jgi:hypothetical protein
LVHFASPGKLGQLLVASDQPEIVELADFGSIVRDPNKSDMG